MSEFLEHCYTHQEKREVVLDFFGEVNEEEIKSIPSLKFIDSKKMKNIQIISKESVPKIEGVSFIGRYGAWNRSWKTEKVIDEAVNN